MVGELEFQIALTKKGFRAYNKEFKIEASGETYEAAVEELRNKFSQIEKDYENSQLEPIGQSNLSWPSLLFVTFSLIGLVALLVLALSVFQLQKYISSLDLPIDGIVPLSASLGANCNEKNKDNFTFRFEDSCSRQKNCNLVMDLSEFPDPAPGCQKEIDLSFKCGSTGLQRNSSFMMTSNRHEIPISCFSHLSR